MEKLDLSKLKLASSSLGERIKTSGAQMGRTISSKMKEILQSPTPESKVVDEATAESMEEPNWGLNLRICAMISRGEYDGTEIVRAIKKKLAPGKNYVTQSLSLDLLEACTSNCDKVFSEVASERVLEDMVKLIEDSRTEHGNRVRAMQLIRAWGETEDLDYLPVFRQTYEHLKSMEIPLSTQEESFPSMQYNLESYLGQQPLSPPERYPIPNTGAENEVDATYISYGFQSIEENKEFLVTARNTLDILSSILNSDTEPKPLKDDLTLSMLEKCKQSLPVVQRIIESTSDDEVMLFDALSLHDELQLIISRHGELAAASEPGQQMSNNTEETSGDSKTDKATLPPLRGSTTEMADYSEVRSTDSNKPSHQEESADKSS
ncbi:TOM1-like protein 2 [Sesamum indicum]|uniref:TOM1-like protein 2 n=1 Tax=Sesamum indicum TaxID=4182 RepID=A0A6I9TC05_SESIN|nr:TOM1-like protein 2 [Sesamum indicum]